MKIFVTQLTKIANGKKVHINISEIKNPELDAILVAENIAQQLGAPHFVPSCNETSDSTYDRSGAKGIKTSVSGRLGGAEIARTEGYSEGTVPLHTLRADIDYGTAEAHTTYGRIGVKVWIYRGEILPRRKKLLRKEATNHVGTKTRKTP